MITAKDFKKMVNAVPDYPHKAQPEFAKAAAKSTADKKSVQKEQQALLKAISQFLSDLEIQKQFIGPVLREAITDPSLVNSKHKAVVSNSKYSSQFRSFFVDLDRADQALARVTNRNSNHACLALGEALGSFGGAHGASESSQILMRDTYIKPILEYSVADEEEANFEKNYGPKPEQPVNPLQERVAAHSGQSEWYLTKAEQKAERKYDKEREKYFYDLASYEKKKKKAEKERMDPKYRSRLTASWMNTIAERDQTATKFINGFLSLNFQAALSKFNAQAELATAAVNDVTPVDVQKTDNVQPTTDTTGK